jgi:hypothetical protein
LTGLLNSQDYETCTSHCWINPSNDNGIYESSYSNRWPHPIETQIPGYIYTYTHTYIHHMGVHSMPVYFTLGEIVSGAEWIGSLVASRNGLQEIDIDIYLIPKIQMWLQPLNTECVINKSMKAQSKHRTSHKMKHIYIYIYIYTHTHTHTRTSPIYKFIHITYKPHFYYENEIQLQLWHKR